MNRPDDTYSAEQLAAQLDAEIKALAVRNTPNVRRVRRRFSRRLRKAPAGLVLAAARQLLEEYGQRWVAYELIRDHPPAFATLGPAELEALGQGMASWGAVDSFARTLSGPAWLAGQVPDAVIDRWAGSADRWWRRAALVSTVALNVRSHGGLGDVPRTLAVCRQLADDPDDMVVKALSWALRELVVHDEAAVRGFLQEYDEVLAARVKREVNNKLETGLKSPSRLALKLLSGFLLALALVGCSVATPGGATPEAVGVVVDDAEQAVELQGPWQTAQKSCAYGGACAWAPLWDNPADGIIDPEQAATAVVRPPLTEPGLYEIYAWWCRAPGRALASTQRIWICASRGYSCVAAYINPQENEGQWNSLGTFYMEPDADVTVKNSARQLGAPPGQETIADGAVVVDAFKFVYRGPRPETLTPPPDQPQPSPTATAGP